MSSSIPFDLPDISEDGSDFVLAARPTNFGEPMPGKSRELSPYANYGVDMHYEQSQRFTGLGLEITSSVIGNLIGHPCIVLRRQCQVNRKALRYHLSPFTLIPVVIRLQNRQGIKTLWKGAGGIFILRGIAVVIETFLAEITPFPREICYGASIKSIVQHLVLKSLSFGILTPFFCSSLIETVQSDIASEKPGVFDCLREGICRMFRWGTPQSTRLLPLWKLVGPTMAYGLLNYIVSSLVKSVFIWIFSTRLQRNLQNPDAQHKDQLTAALNYFDSLTASCCGQMMAEILLFPAETVINRLYLQGTRTIIDNLDSGISVIPIISKYEGAIDCFHTIVQEEGSMGLYKGFGSLVIEYALQMIILKTAKIVYEEIAAMFAAKPQKTIT